MRRPGIEPGSSASQTDVLPLYYRLDLLFINNKSMPYTLIRQNFILVFFQPVTKIILDIISILISFYIVSCTNTINIHTSNAKEMICHHADYPLLLQDIL